MEDSPAAPSPLEGSITVSSNREEPSGRPKKARRTFLTQNACTRCRQKKSKCDGKRPVCGRCERNGAECVYDVAQEGITRMQNLQQLLERKNEDHERMMVLFNAFRHGSDDMATNLLARLRIGETVESLISGLDISLLDTPVGDVNDTSDSQDSKYRQSFPTSPLEAGSWTSWGDRCHSSGRTFSQSSEPQSSTPRPSTSFKSLDNAQNPHSGLEGQVDGGYYQMLPSRSNFHERPYFNSPTQWQQEHIPERDNNPNSPRTMFSASASPDGFK